MSWTTECAYGTPEILHLECIPPQSVRLDSHLDDSNSSIGSPVSFHTPLSYNPSDWSLDSSEIELARIDPQPPLFDISNGALPSHCQSIHPQNEDRSQADPLCVLADCALPPTTLTQEWPEAGFGPWQQRFSDASAACAWLKAAKSRPYHCTLDGTITDPSIPLVEASVDGWARKVYDAMRNLDDIIEAERSVVVKGFKNRVIYSQEHMEASAYNIVIESIKLHKFGRSIADRWDHSRRSIHMACIAKYDGRHDQTFYLTDRLQAIIDQLKISKAAVRGVLEGGLPLQKLVVAPLASDKNRRNQRRSNLNKAAYIKDGVSVRQIEGQEFPKKSKFNSRHAFKPGLQGESKPNLKSGNSPNDGPYAPPLRRSARNASFKKITLIFDKKKPPRQSEP